jgi:hypothetical protein
VTWPRSSIQRLRLQVNLQQRPQRLQPLRPHPIHQVRQQILLPRLAEDHPVHRQRPSKVFVAAFVLAEGDGGDVALDGGAALGVEDPERDHAAVEVGQLGAGDLEEGFPRVAGVEARFHRGGLRQGGRFARRAVVGAASKATSRIQGNNGAMVNVVPIRVRRRTNAGGIRTTSTTLVLPRAPTSQFSLIERIQNIAKATLAEMPPLAFIAFLECCARTMRSDDRCCRYARGSVPIGARSVPRTHFHTC